MARASDRKAGRSRQNDSASGVRPASSRRLYASKARSRSNDRRSNSGWSRTAPATSGGVPSRQACLSDRASSAADAGGAGRGAGMGGPGPAGAAGGTGGAGGGGGGGRAGGSAWGGSCSGEFLQAPDDPADRADAHVGHPGDVLQVVPLPEPPQDHPVGLRELADQPLP